MTAAGAWIVSIMVMLAVGTAATLYVRLVLLRRDETAAGIVALSGMSWRQFIHVVLETLARRGYARVVDRDAALGDADFTLARDRRQWLLACKHGSAFVLGIPAVTELANAIRVQGAAGGLLVTQGQISADAYAPAKLQHIELLDGPTLWPEARELVPPEQLAAIRAGADQRARQRVLMAWLVALLAGVASFITLPRVDAPAPAIAPPPGSAAAGATAVDNGTLAAAPADAPGADPASVEQQREAVASAISTLPMVDRASWSTQSTLEVRLLETESDAFAAICPLMERYDALASSRVQLMPPEGSTQGPRFRQCRSY